MNADSDSAAVESGAPFADPSREADYQAARARFLKPAVSGGGLLLFFVSLAVYLALSAAGGVTNMVILVAVLLFHELGHYVAMLALGYRDMRMFFIPFFGAAVSGRPTNPSQTREAIVLLLGPVPGIVFGVSTAFAAVMFHSQTLKTITEYLAGINVLNLLPLVPLDGGRLAEVLLFSRWRWTEAPFVGLTLLAGCVGGFAAGMPVFGGMSLVFLALLPMRIRMARVATRVREEGVGGEPGALDDGATRVVYGAVRAALAEAKANVVGEWMIQVLEIGSRRAPSMGRSVALAGVWAVAFCAGLFAIALAAAVK